MDTGLLLDGYDAKHLTIACFGGRNALDIAHGAKQCGLKSLVVARQGREPLYAKHYKTRKRGKEEAGCVDDVLVVEELTDVLTKEVRADLRARNAIFIQSKYFWRRFPSYGDVEQAFDVPMFGSRSLLRLEGRDQPYTQRDLLSEAGIRIPRRFNAPEDIDRLAIVKVRDELRGYGRTFFLAWDKESFEEEAQRRIKLGQIAPKELERAVIEEYVVGALVNFHFFFSPLHSELELVGIDVRRQTNIEGLQRMTPSQQKIVLGHVPLQMVEVGHTPSTLRESLVDGAFGLAEDFLGVTQSLPREIDPTGKGMVGPFTLQGVIAAEGGREEIVLFGVCFRPTTCPGIAATPYGMYLHRKPLTMGERIAMEISEAARDGRLHEIVT
ncbi:MAG: ATP-utilizing enzyme of ATP-grasp superfamily [Candidatus Peregrinibacteria bacterium Gr01-1014_25]|nr:MAG: ATP-utilizing enzyme of ATP-grasp superfamily [Candidatus Peregrinibacteria bacterium Gr01-1014_25]